jgi:very-short-patch-repair endonuclease
MDIKETIFNISKYKNRRRELRQKSTVAEMYFWNAVKKKQLGFKFRRQASIGHYIVDFHCVEKTLVVEIDGGIHLSSEAKDYDRERDSYLEAIGLTVIRFTNEEIIKKSAGSISARDF